MKSGPIGAVLAAAILLVSTPLAKAEAADENARVSGPLVPLNTNFWSYWTHYWATWLPDHPVYEMIELTAYESPDGSGNPLLRLLLTERQGRKTQYFYLNDRNEVERSRTNSFYSDLVYRRSGRSDGPQDLYVSFVDKDGVAIEWTIEFDSADELRVHDRGTTDSIHSVGSVLLFALRTRTVDTHRDRVLFDGVNFAHQGAAEDDTPGTRSWYNPDYYSAVIIFGGLQFEYGEQGEVSNSWGRRFAPLPHAPGIYRSNLLGPDNFIWFETDDSNALKSYSHVSRGHALNFVFDPPLPPLPALRPGTSFRFGAYFDQDKPLMSGDIHVREREDGAVLLEWRPSVPEWAVDREFGSLIRGSASGYELLTGELAESATESSPGD